MSRGMIDPEVLIEEYVIDRIFELAEDLWRELKVKVKVPDIEIVLKGSPDFYQKIIEKWAEVTDLSK